jgi:hypothetical protein
MGVVDRSRLGGKHPEVRAVTKDSLVCLLGWTKKRLPMGLRSVALERVAVRERRKERENVSKKQWRAMAAAAVRKKRVVVVVALDVVQQAQMKKRRSWVVSLGIAGRKKNDDDGERTQVKDWEARKSARVQKACVSYFPL